MKNGLLFICISVLLLTACGGDDSSKIDQPQLIDTVYALDAFSGEYDIAGSSAYVNYKTYYFDSKYNLSLKYDYKPLFKTEVLRNYLTPDGLLRSISKPLENVNYLIGEQARFDGENLQYTVSNYIGSRPLTLSWKYKKIDLSGKPIQSDLNNPIHSIGKNATVNILFQILGIDFAPTDVFPEGAICWQKQSAKNSQDYIEFYPEKIIRHVDEISAIEKTETWNKVTWIQYQVDANEPARANIKIVLDNKTYWGIYHPANEAFSNATNGLACDLMNEKALNVSSKLLTMPDFKETYLMMLEAWVPFYSDNEL